MNNYLERIILGTVQWGMDYGISNKLGKPSKKEVEKILNFAKSKGCFKLDTAPVYGNSQNIIGELASNDFEIITKIKISQKELNIKNNFLRSLQNLNRKFVHGLLLHDPSVLLEYGAINVFEQLTELKSLGLINKIGISGYCLNEIQHITSVFPIDIIQIPYNILSCTDKYSKFFDQMKKNDIEIHVRSVYLQGLLLMEKSELSRKFNKFAPIIDEIRMRAQQHEVTVPEYLLQYPLQNGAIDYVVVGVVSEEQLKIIDNGHKKIDYFNFNQTIFNERKLLDPRNWT